MGSAPTERTLHVLLLNLCKRGQRADMSEQSGICEGGLLPPHCPIEGHSADTRL